MGLFLESQFYSIDLYAYSFESTLVLVMENKHGILTNRLVQ